MKRLVVALVIMVLGVGLLTGCKKEQEEASSTETESVGPKRVVALSSSWANLWSLAGGELMGVTADVTTDEEMKARVSLSQDYQQIGTVQKPNLEMILGLEPDLILVSEDLGAHQPVVATLEEAGIAYYELKIESFDDYLEALLDFTELTGEKERYKEYGTDLRDEIDQLIAEVPEEEKGQSALLMRAFSSGLNAISGEHVVCDIFEHIGISNVTETTGLMLEELSLEAILEANPDYIFILTMGDEEKAKENIRVNLEADPAWQTLTAVQNDRVVFLEKELYHYKPNEKWVQAYAGILQTVYPDTY